MLHASPRKRQRKQRFVSFCEWQRSFQQLISSRMLLFAGLQRCPLFRCQEWEIHWRGRFWYVHYEVLMGSNDIVWHSQVSAANFFCIVDGALLTPKLGSILAGITRDSVLRIAQDLGLEVAEYVWLLGPSVCVPHDWCLCLSGPRNRHRPRNASYCIWSFLLRNCGSEWPYVRRQYSIDLCDLGVILDRLWSLALTVWLVAQTERLLSSLPQETTEDGECSN